MGKQDKRQKKVPWKGRQQLGKARQLQGLTWGTMVSSEFDLEGRMTTHIQKPEMDRWIAAEGIQIVLNIDLVHLREKTKEKL